LRVGAANLLDLRGKDFANETLVTYPIPYDRIDVFREVWPAANVHPARRKTSLRVAILQLVARTRALAAMPQVGGAAVS